MKAELIRAYEKLFLAVRNVLELSENVGQEVLIDWENFDDLVRAHHEVYKQKEASCYSAE